jgi:hypothetical protein
MFGSGATKKKSREGAMSHSIYGADRKTHLKIVVVSLVCATLVAAVGIAARVDHATSAHATATGKTRPGGPVIKAGQPIEVTGQVPAIR